MLVLSKNNLQKLFTSYVIILPILNIYCSHYINALRIGEIVGVFMAILLLASTKSKFVLSNIEYWIAIAYIFFQSIVLTGFIPTYTISDTFVRLGRVLFYTYFALRLAPSFFNWEFGVNLYIKLSVLCSLVLITQFVIFQVSFNFVPFVLPGMNLSTNFSNSEEYYHSLIQGLDLYGKGFRCSGFFLEPAHFCEFIIFSLVFLLIEKNYSKINLFYLGIIVISIIICGSAIGLFCLAIIFISTRFYRLTAYKFLFSLPILFLAVIVAYRLNLFEKAFYRVSTISSTIEATTGNLRLLRGYVIYNELPLFYKIFGMGFGNYENFIEYYNIQTMYDSFLPRSNEFMNGISVILTSGGLIGLSVCFAFFMKLYFRLDYERKIIFYVFMLIFFSSNIFYKETYMLGVIFLICTNKFSTNILAHQCTVLKKY